MVGLTLYVYFEVECEWEKERETKKEERKKEKCNGENTFESEFRSIVAMVRFVCSLISGCFGWTNEEWTGKLLIKSTEAVSQVLMVLSDRVLCACLRRDDHLSPKSLVARAAVMRVHQRHRPCLDLVFVKEAEESRASLQRRRLPLARQVPRDFQQTASQWCACWPSPVPFVSIPLR